MSSRSAQPVVYRIDGDDRLVAVNDAWRDFAHENGAPQLADGAVGRSLWDFVEGDSCRQIWELLVERVRGGAPVNVPYRCDSAGERRRMTMSMRRFGDDGVEFVSATIALEPREPVPHYELLRACSWCNRFFVGEWVEPEAAVAALGILEQPTPAVTHGMCPDCQAEIFAALEAS